ncbi:MAG: tRNA pseudouridine(38-40) synthase TruA [Actinomycetota bacterium]
MPDALPPRERRVAPPPPEGMVRVRMRVAYDGAGFAGFAKNADVRTIEGELEATLALVLRHDVKLTCAGRTDRGVHARGQVITFDADASHFEPSALSRALNRMLGPEMAFDRVEQAPPDFDARFGCTGRTYRYHVHNHPTVDPLYRHVRWHVRETLDLEAMNAAAGHAVGVHDFTTFSKKNKSRPHESFVRDVRAADWSVDGDATVFEITANAFTHQMVRSLVGMLVEIGRGRRDASEMPVVLTAMERDAAPSPAPGHGLVLWEAHYDAR